MPRHNDTVQRHNLTLHSPLSLGLQLTFTVRDDVVLSCINTAARQVDLNGNAEPWKFRIVRGKTLSDLQTINEQLVGDEWSKWSSTPNLLIVTATKPNAPMSTVFSAMAIHSFMLAMKAEGISTKLFNPNVAFFRSEEVLQKLNIFKGEEDIVGVVHYGFCTTSSRTRPLNEHVVSVFD